MGHRMNSADKLSGFSLYVVRHVVVNIFVKVSLTQQNLGFFIERQHAVMVSALKFVILT